MSTWTAPSSRPPPVKRVVLICAVLAGLLFAGCSTGGASQAEISACTPFLDMARLSESTTSPTISLQNTASAFESGTAYSLPTTWVTHLLDSGNPELVGDAKTFERGQTGSETIGTIESECRQLGA